VYFISTKFWRCRFIKVAEHGFIKSESTNVFISTVRASLNLNPQMFLYPRLETLFTGYNKLRFECKFLLCLALRRAMSFLTMHLAQVRCFRYTAILCCNNVHWQFHDQLYCDASPMRILVKQYSKIMPNISFSGLGKDIDGITTR